MRIFNNIKKHIMFLLSELCTVGAAASLVMELAPHGSHQVQKSEKVNSYAAL